MLARAMVLATVLPPLPCSTTRRGSRPVQCDDRATCRDASHLRSHLRSWNLATTHHGHPEAAHVQLEKAGSGWYILRRIAVSASKGGHTTVVKLC